MRMRIGRVHVFVAFAFTVMADPVSSVAYAIEAALRGLDGDLSSLFPTMAAIVAIIAVVSATYDELIRRFPNGGGGPEGLAAAFGESWAFIPLGALLVDFTLTVAVSCAAGASALVAYLPGLAPVRTLVGLALVASVAGVVLLGQLGRVAFAVATQLFLVLAAVVIVAAMVAEPAVGVGGGAAPRPLLLSDAAIASVLLAVPLGMALATGVEAPSNAIAQLPQLEDQDRRLFGRWTLWLMVAIVGALTMGFAAAAVRLAVDVPSERTTLLAELARQSLGNGTMFAVFQIASALLLLSAAASSYLAGSGVLKALATLGRENEGLVSGIFARINRFLVPEWGVAVVLAAAAILVAAGGHEQRLVPFYAVAVFASFLAATLGCARLSYRDRRWGSLTLNLIGSLLVGAVLVINAARPAGVIALIASAVVAVYLWRVWVKRGRPAGVADVGARA
jgi:hypothetical protein